MGGVTNLSNLPRTGLSQPEIHLDTDVTIGAAAAKRRVNIFLAAQAGNLLLADQPALVLARRSVWRVPVDVIAPSMGRLARIGEVDVDVASGELLLDDAEFETMRTQAEALVASAIS